MTRQTSWFPDLPPLVAAVLFHGLLDEQDVFTPEQWRDASPTLIRHRLAGLALALIKGREAGAPRDVVDQLRASFAKQSAISMRLEAAAPSIDDALRSESVPLLFTKGIGIARAHKDPTLRTFVDLDVLVPPSQFRQALAVLRAQGFAGTGPEPRDYFIHRCREAVNLVHPHDHLSVDLHHHIPPWIWGARIPFEELLKDAATIHLQAGSIKTLSPHHNLLVAALHVISDKNKAGRSLMIWRDVAELAASVRDQDALRALSGKNLGWLVSTVLEAIPETLRPHWLGRLVTDDQRPLDRWRLAKLLPGGLGSRVLAPAFRLPPANALAYLLGYALPSRKYLTLQDGSTSYLKWWRRAASHAAAD